MELNRRTFVVYVLLAFAWLVVAAWQLQEHVRVEKYARSALLSRSKDIADTLGSFIRGLEFRGAVLGNRLQPVLEELISDNSGDRSRSGELLSVAVLNALGEPIASAGRLSAYPHPDLQDGERWGPVSLVIAYPIEGVRLSSEGNTNTVAPVLLPPRTNAPRGDSSRPFQRYRGPPSEDFTPGSDRRPPPEPDDARPRRPFWARTMQDQEYQSMIQKRELHGLVLTMSTTALQATIRNDLWLRFTIIFFAAAAAVGSALAWRNLTRSSDLQLRLVRASQQNTHLKELNLAAAGLAHETRNPLNIIRGLAQMISREEAAPPRVQEKSREIVNEADKVAAQLNEFINYSRPREVRRTSVALGAVVQEVARALKFDLEEKRVDLRISGETLAVVADEQLLRQALFNLMLNAVQAVEPGGSIEVAARKETGGEATLEIRDDGPGVPPELRKEIFKPYFTAQKNGTGLGLAVVQQIVLAHGWNIECDARQPKGAVFRIQRIGLDPHHTRLATRAGSGDTRMPGAGPAV